MRPQPEEGRESAGSQRAPRGQQNGPGDCAATATVNYAGFGHLGGAPAQLLLRSEDDVGGHPQLRAQWSGGEQHASKIAEAAPTRTAKRCKPFALVSQTWNTPPARRSVTPTDTAPQTVASDVGTDPGPRALPCQGRLCALAWGNVGGPADSGPHPTSGFLQIPMASYPRPERAETTILTGDQDAVRSNPLRILLLVHFGPRLTSRTPSSPPPADTTR